MPALPLPARFTPAVKGGEAVRLKAAEAGRWLLLDCCSDPVLSENTAASMPMPALARLVGLPPRLLLGLLLRPLPNAAFMLTGRALLLLAPVVVMVAGKRPLTGRDEAGAAFLPLVPLR